MTMLFVSLLVAGCVGTRQIDTFCINYQPAYFGQDATVDWLLLNDRDFLEVTVSNNQKWEHFCT